MTSQCPRCAAPRPGQYPFCIKCGFDFQPGDAAAAQPAASPPPPDSPQPPAPQDVQPTPPPAIPTICTRCHAPLYPGYTRCGNCGFDNAAPWGAMAPARSSRSTLLPIALALGVVAILAASCLTVFLVIQPKSAVASPTTTAAPSAIATATAGPTASPSPTATPSPTAPAGPLVEGKYPRVQTLITTGKQWGPPTTWNPLDPNAAMGVVGLQYETLFLYNPLDDTYRPWLATSDSGWDSSKTTYTIKVRSGVKWSDGSALTADDVAFTIQLQKNANLGSNLWTYVSSASATDSSTVVVKFNNPEYQEWSQWLYNCPIVPRAVFESKNNADILKFTNDQGIGSGPYTNLTHSDTEMVWQKNPNWWATAALGLEVTPKYIIDLVNGTNDATIAGLIAGDIDLSNNYLPGIDAVVKGGHGVSTYYSGPPYMLAGETAVLVPNLAKKPLNDPAFRKALATAIDLDGVAKSAYGDIAAKSDPTGLLPVWSQYIDTAQSGSLGVSFSTAKAKSMLAAAGYPDVNGDGWVENKDGSTLKLTLEVPDGWTDWMTAENTIAANARAAGIDVAATHPDYSTVVGHRNRPDASTPPTFDLVLNNDVPVGNTPWTWYDYIFRQPLPYGPGENRNYEGYSNAAAWALVQQLDKTPVDDPTTMKSICSQLQKIQLTDMPVIPLWYNGLWSQVSNDHWTDWPSESGKHELPATWNGFWQMGAVLMLTQITPVAGG